MAEAGGDVLRLEGITRDFGEGEARTRVLGSVFYPPWLREGPNATHAQAYLLASEGYSFITFRAARDL